MKLFFALFALGPALFGFSAGYLLLHPAEWTGPAVVLPASAALTAATHLWGGRWLRRRIQGIEASVLQIGGLVMAPVLFVMTLTVLR
jgi:hypothetical protein